MEVSLWFAWSVVSVPVCLSDYDLLSSLDDDVSLAAQHGATQAEIARLPLHVVG